MDEQELKREGARFQVGEDLYGLSVGQLQERINILHAEIKRLESEMTKKALEKQKADLFFRKS